MKIEIQKGRLVVVKEQVHLEDDDQKTSIYFYDISDPQFFNKKEEILFGIANLLYSQ